MSYFLLAVVFLLFLASLVFFCVAALFYTRARIVLESVETIRAASEERTRILQERALAAERDALDLAAQAREYVL